MSVCRAQGKEGGEGRRRGREQGREEREGGEGGREGGNGGGEEREEREKKCVVVCQVSNWRRTMDSPKGTEDIAGHGCITHFRQRWQLALRRRMSQNQAYLALVSGVHLVPTSTK